MHLHEFYNNWFIKCLFSRDNVFIEKKITNKIRLKVLRYLKLKKNQF
jgi:hypothetical protein